MRGRCEPELGGSFLFQRKFPIPFPLTRHRENEKNAASPEAGARLRLAADRMPDLGEAERGEGRGITGRARPSRPMSGLLPEGRTDPPRSQPNSRT